MNAECAICYVADKDFLLPTLASAVSIRRFVRPEKAAIAIFTVGVDENDVSEANYLTESQGIRLQSIDLRRFDLFDRARLAKTYTPLSTFGRFFFEELLPASYERIIYLDGDVWAVENPAALIEAAVPPGHLAAADDTVFLRQLIGYGRTAKRTRTHISQLGLTTNTGYFNAGVFAVNRATWRTIAREAYTYYIEHQDLCVHFDQSALNAIVGNKRLRLSAKWNFQTQHRIWRADRYIKPRIYHFNRYPKPWMAACDPWADVYLDYQSALAPFRQLKLPLSELTAQEARSFNSATRKAYNYLQLPLVSRLALNIMRFRTIEQSAWM